MNEPDFLNEKSLMQARWRLKRADLDQVDLLVRQYDLPEVVARLLVGRGVPPDAMEEFLYPTLKQHFPNPLSLKDMDAAATYIAQAITDGKRMAIFGDFDVDGATSSALLYRFLKACGVEARIYIPERLTEGYGPNNEALQALKDEGAEIVFLLDCGTTAFEPVAYARSIGLEVVIVDHHEAEDKLPDANFIINPKRKDDESGLGMMAAVGVTFMTCVAVNTKLREQGFYKNKNMPEPALKDSLDLVALGTVCDMVPLTSVNRLLVRLGFTLMNETKNNGLRALINVAGIKDKLGTYHAGFILGPRINAGSRVDKSELGAVLLTTDNPEEAHNIAWTLNDANDKRKSIQAAMEREAMAKVEAKGLDQYPVIIVEDENWHPGLQGLVAGRLKDKYGKPACVITYYEKPDGSKEMRGSGRSVPGVHIAQSFMDARGAGVLEKGGGHAMAGGFTLLPVNLERFRNFMCHHVEAQTKGQIAQIETGIDAMVTVQGANPRLVKTLLEHVGPFGQECPEPLFLFQNIRIHTADVLGDAHIRLMISDVEGTTRLKAMAFKAVGTPLGEALLKMSRQNFHLLGHLKLDTWNGRERVEIHIKDAVLAAYQERKTA